MVPRNVKIQTDTLPRNASLRSARRTRRPPLHTQARQDQRQKTSSTDQLLLQRGGAGAARGALYSVPELADVNPEFGDGAAQGVAVHAQFAGGAALVAFVFLEDGQDETLLEFPHAFGIKNVAAVHLEYKCFQLIFHASLFAGNFCCTAAYLGGDAGEFFNCWGA